MVFMELSFLFVSCFIPFSAALALTPSRNSPTVWINAFMGASLALGIFSILTLAAMDMLTAIIPPFVFEALTVNYSLITILAASIPSGLIFFWGKQISIQEKI